MKIGDILVVPKENIIGAVVKVNEIDNDREVVLDRVVCLTKQGNVSERWKVHKFPGFKWKWKELPDSGFWNSRDLRIPSKKEESSYRKYITANPVRPKIFERFSGDPQWYELRS